MTGRGGGTAPLARTKNLNFTTLRDCDGKEASRWDQGGLWIPSSLMEPMSRLRSWASLFFSCARSSALNTARRARFSSPSRRMILNCGCDTRDAPLASDLPVTRRGWGASDSLSETSWPTARQSDSKRSTPDLHRCNRCKRKTPLLGKLLYLNGLASSHTEAHMNPCTIRLPCLPASVLHCPALRCPALHLLMPCPCPALFCLLLPHSYHASTLPSTLWRSSSELNFFWKKKSFWHFFYF